ncbi:MAG: phosphoribosylanthranilate isomerase, partial [Solirubrobacteraceae bacterium]|nr:phosphoribosylanthranilate isomerase [Solirubrobacteraceae bacterium]
MPSTRIKFCGITRLEDAIAAADAGAWAIGFILWPGSARAIDPAEAAMIARQLRRRVRIAGVFVDQGMDEVVRLSEQVGLDLVQLHGTEGPSYCSEIQHRTGAQIIKAARVATIGDITNLQGAFRIDIDFHLLDAFVDGEMGGTGQTFDHKLAREHRRRTALILSGGLTAENVGEAIKQVAPFAVDVSSGVEVSPGVKDPAMIEAFAAAVAAATPEEPASPEEAGHGEESVWREASGESGDWPAGSADKTTDARGELMPDTGEEVAQMRDEEENTQPLSGAEPETTPQDGAQEELQPGGETTEPTNDDAATAPEDHGARAGVDDADEPVASDSVDVDVPESASDAQEAELDDLDPLEDSEDDDEDPLADSADDRDPTDDLVVGDGGDSWAEVTSEDASAQPEKPTQRGGGYRGPTGDFPDENEGRGGPRGGAERGPKGGGFRDRDDRGPRGGGFGG